MDSGSGAANKYSQGSSHPPAAILDRPTTQAQPTSKAKARAAPKMPFTYYIGDDIDGGTDTSVSSDSFQSAESGIDSYPSTPRDSAGMGLSDDSSGRSRSNPRSLHLPSSTSGSGNVSPSSSARSRSDRLMPQTPDLSDAGQISDPEEPHGTKRPRDNHVLKYQRLSSICNLRNSQ